MKHLRLLFTALLVGIIFSVQAQDASYFNTTIDGIKYSLHDTKATVTGCEQSVLYGTTELRIPATINYEGYTYKVSEILHDAFNYSKQGYSTVPTLRKIMLSSDSIRIGKNAFSGLPLDYFILPFYVEGDNLYTQQNAGRVYEYWISSDDPKLSPFYNCTNLRYLIDRWDGYSLIFYSLKPNKKLGLAPIVPDNCKVYRSSNIITWRFTSPTYDYNGTDIPYFLNFQNNLPGWTAKIDFSKVPHDVGTWKVDVPFTFTNDDDGETFPFYIPYEYTIKPRKLTVNVADASREYGEENPRFALSYTGFVNGENEDVLDSKVIATTSATKTSDVGSYSISLSGGKAKNYEFEYKTGTLTVTKAPLTASIKDTTKTYGAHNPQFTIRYSGLKNNEKNPYWSKEPVLSCNADNKSSVGKYAIHASGFEARNYNLDKITSGELTVLPAPLTIKVNDKQRLYFEENPDFTCTYSGFVNTDNESQLSQKPVITTSAVKTSPAGEYKIEARDAKASNYNISYQDGRLEIQKRPLVVSSPDYERAYNEDNPDVKLSYAGFVNNEDTKVLTELPKATINATKKSDVGVYDITISGGLADNYNFSYKGGKLTINKAQQELTWYQDLSNIVKGSQIELTAKASSGLDVDYIIPVDNVASIYKVAGTTYMDCFNEGSFILRAVQEGNNNYYPCVRISKEVTIIDPTGIQGVRSTGKGYSLDGNVLTFMDGQMLYSVYTIDGKTIFTGKGNQSVKLDKGVYIIRTGATVSKIQIK